MCYNNYAVYRDVNGRNVSLLQQVSYADRAYGYKRIEQAKLNNDKNIKR